MHELENQNKVEERFSDIVTVFVFLNAFDESNLEAEFVTKNFLFHPHIGWDMKDVCPMGLPQDLRFSILREVVEGKRNGRKYYALRVIRG